MEIPDFLEPATTITVGRHASVAVTGAPAAHPAGRGASPAPGSRRLPLNNQTQDQTRWCWAAVGCSISHFYDPASRWSQCQVVNVAMSRNDCCAGPAASDRAQCNQDGYLERALRITGNLDGVQRRALGFDEVRDEIDQGRVIGCRLEWIGGGGHFLALTGWVVGHSGDEYAWVADPIYLESRVSFSGFPSTYEWGADWTHSYWSRSVPALGGASPQVAGPTDVSYPEAIGA